MKRCPRCRRRHGESYSHCTSCRAYLREWKARQRAERRAVALCPGCGGKREEGFAFCEACREWTQARRERLQWAGLCRMCGRPRDSERSDLLCDPCSDKRNALQKRQLLVPERYASHRATCANWRRKRRAAASIA